MYLGRYARQDAVALSNVPTVTLLSWVEVTAELMSEENRNSKKG